MTQFSQTDSHFMIMALEAARKAKGRTFPNPAVGAVLVKQGKVLAVGATSKCGGPHSEINALRKAGSQARGATLYVTLEPCCHYGRTPPCTDALITHGIKKCIASICDPNPLVAGKGLRKLQEKGIEVQSGLMEEEARRINEDFIFSIRRKSAWVTVKLAITWDGRLADIHGESKWISGPEPRTFIHSLRRTHAGIAIGSGTLIKDDPLLTVRRVAGPSPVRFIFSQKGDRLNPEFRICQTAEKVRTIMVIAGPGTSSSSKPKGPYEIWHIAGDSVKSQLQAFLARAYKEGISSVLVEGGHQLASAFLEHNLVNRVYFCFGNTILGNGLPALEFAHGLKVSKPFRLKNMEFVPMGDNIIITGCPYLDK